MDKIRVRLLYKNGDIFDDKYMAPRGLWEIRIARSGGWAGDGEYRDATEYIFELVGTMEGVPIYKERQ